MCSCGRWRFDPRQELTEVGHHTFLVESGLVRSRNKPACARPLPFDHNLRSASKKDSVVSHLGQVQTGAGTGVSQTAK